MRDSSKKSPQFYDEKVPKLTTNLINTLNQRFPKAKGKLQTDQMNGAVYKVCIVRDVVTH